jgi:hypothetical protein
VEPWSDRRGVTLAGLGRLDEAIAAYEQALSIDFNIPAATTISLFCSPAAAKSSKRWDTYPRALEGDNPDARRLAKAAIEELRSSR